MRFQTPVLAILAALTSSMAGAHEMTVKGVTIAHPWARATPAGATVGSAFAEIKTDKDTSDRLISVSSPVATTVELHSMTMDGNVMKMRRLDGIDLKPGETHVLKPMDQHIMLFGLKQPLKQGDTIKLTFTFAKAGPIEADGAVQAPGAMAPPGGDVQPGDSSMTNSMSHDKMHGEMPMGGQAK